MPRIRAALAPTKRALALDSYVGRQAFPLPSVFDSIDRLRPAADDVLVALGAPADGIEDALLALLSSLMEKDETFFTYVSEEREFLDDPLTAATKWKAACDAIAWVILARYRKERGAV